MSEPVKTVGIYLTEQERRHITSIASDLEIREEAALRASDGPESETYAAEHAALTKLMNLPAAIAADKERVRAVVSDAAEFVLGSDIDVRVGNMDSTRLADAIADRVAKQLATTDEARFPTVWRASAPAPALTERERDHRLSIRCHINERNGDGARKGLWASELATLNRLLSGAP